MCKDTIAYGESEQDEIDLIEKFPHQLARMKALNKYDKQVKETDEKLIAQFQKTVRQLEFIYWLNIVFSVLVFVIVIAVIGFSLWFILNSDFGNPGTSIGIGGALISMLALFLGVYFNPLKKAHNSMSNLIKVNIIFLGFVRQINHIDLAYKQSMFTSEFVKMKSVEKTIQCLQESVEQSVDEVMRSLDEI